MGLFGRWSLWGAWNIQVEMSVSGRENGFGVGSTIKSRWDEKSQGDVTVRRAVAEEGLPGKSNS